MNRHLIVLEIDTNKFYRINLETWITKEVLEEKPQLPGQSWVTMERIDEYAMSRRCIIALIEEKERDSKGNARGMVMKQYAASI